MIPAADDRREVGPAATGAAVAVFGPDGALRSRSPADRELFGPGAGDLAARIDDRAGAEAFFGRLRETGAASAVLPCRTVAGRRVFDVSALLLPGGPADGMPPGCVVLTFAPPEAGSAPTSAEDESVVSADRLARLGHELRSPLNAVLGFAEMIRRDARVRRPGPGRAAEYATDIVAAAWRLMGLADDMVALGETRTGAQFLRMGEVDLGRIARRIARLAAPVAASAGVRIELGGLPDPGAGPVMLGDEGALWSVLDNLLQNAIRHAGGDGRVRIAMSGPGPDGGICLEIADDGRGLDRAALAEALAPGGRPDAAGPGPGRPGGLGLPIARDLIEAHDGVLEIDTAPGEGFRARIHFPAARVLDI